MELTGKDRVQAFRKLRKLEKSFKHLPTVELNEELTELKASLAVGAVTPARY